MRESTGFSAMMEELDRKALLMFPKASFITIGRWLEWGEFLSNALKTSSTVAPQMKSARGVSVTLPTGAYFYTFTETKAGAILLARHTLAPVA